MLIFLEFLFVSIIWFCNVLYFAFAEFQNKSLRFILMLFLGFGYIISLAGGFKNKKGYTFRVFLIFRLCTVSHFHYFIDLFFTEKIETTYNLFIEALIIVFYWMPVITIEAVNNKSIGKNSGMYLGVIVLNSLYFAIIAIRVFEILLKNINQHQAIPNNQKINQVRNDLKVEDLENLDNYNGRSAYNHTAL